MMHGDIMWRKLSVGFGLLLVAVSPAVAQERESESDVSSEAIKAVASALEPNSLGVVEDDLRHVQNSRGDGVFVYVSQTRYSGVERYIIWIFIERRVYPLNGATKALTPTLPWPREAPQELWKKTGLSPYVATEAIEIVFKRGN